MSLHLRPLVRYCATLLVLHPLVVLVVFDHPRGAEILEAQLVLIGVLFALGVRGSLSRERMEYLSMLPLGRERATLVADRSALVPLAVLAALTYASHVTGCLAYGVRWGWHLLSPSSDPAVWKMHLERALWLNAFGLPILAYWVSTWVLGHLRFVSKGWTVSTSMWVPAVALLLSFLAFLLFGVSEVRSFEHDPLLRSLPGVLALAAAFVLSRRERSRALEIGIDAFPEEGEAWDS